MTSGLIIPLDFLRQSRPHLNRATLKVFGRVMRRREYHSISGFTYLLCGEIILLAFFHHHIVNIALLFLAFGDPMASYVGIKFGTEKIVGNKTLQGAIAAFVICTLIAEPLLLFQQRDAREDFHRGTPFGPARRWRGARAHRETR